MRSADNMFYFTCFNVDDPDDPSVGLINGELAIPGNLLRREVLDPVVEEVCGNSLSSEHILTPDKCGSLVCVIIHPFV